MRISGAIVTFEISRWFIFKFNFVNITYMISSNHISNKNRSSGSLVFGAKKIGLNKKWHIISWANPRSCYLHGDKQRWNNLIKKPEGSASKRKLNTYYIFFFLLLGKLTFTDTPPTTQFRLSSLFHLISRSLAGVLWMVFLLVVCYSKQWNICRTEEKSYNLNYDKVLNCFL